MRTPNADHAIVDDEKILDYLLATAHPVGGSKAIFFRSIGFNERNIKLFRVQLLKIVKTCTVQEVKISPYGVKYIVDGVIESPTDQKIQVRTIWIIEEGKNIARLVTAHPI
jgi:hypothetical protein